MRFPKKVLTLMLALCCSVGMIVPASATGVQPLYLAVLEASADLSISSGGKATCSIYVETNQCSQHIEANTALYRINGNKDTRVAFWVAGKDHTVSETKTYEVSKGYTYQLRSYITITNSSGDIIESCWRYSNIVYY